MKKYLLKTIVITFFALNIQSCVETCEGECEIDENGKLDCPCDDF